mmetsp:Transcript_918/g.1174  ORF Transcript_918/g.1174 Transcript_918/m.1174 type:complete len:359 (-) Transcript_918:206-1282(-)
MSSNLILPLSVAAVVSVVGMSITAIVGVTRDNGGTVVMGSNNPSPQSLLINTGNVDLTTRGPPSGVNPCDGAKIQLDNVQCAAAAINGQLNGQSGANVTKGYVGDLDVDVEPIAEPYYKKGLCPVNVHWHEGAEHLSVGEYDEMGTGPTGKEEAHRALAGEVREGFQCRYYDENEDMFTKPYEWKHCVGMKVGQTYEVHWPHSAAGSCGTVNQYQTPFYDGVFCNLDMDTLVTLGAQDIANNVGVQAQVFTIVNDETYYYPDLMRGMVVDGAMGSDIAYYTGSTTGTSRDNTICSQYSPITWQVDRKCHMVSASSFDKMCADMKAQRDDMSDDLYAHGSRVLVADEFAADNGKRLLRA